MTYNVAYLVTLRGEMLVEAVNPKEALRAVERMGSDELVYHSDSIVSVEADLAVDDDDLWDEPDVDERQEHNDFANDEDY